MRPIVFAIIALFLIALNNVIVEWKLSRVSPVVNVIFIHSILFLITIPIFLICLKNKNEFNWHHGYQWLILIGYCFISISAGWCVLTAYHRGASVLMMTTTLAGVPIVAALLRGFLNGNWPNTTQWIGCVLAILAVILVSRPS